MASANSTPAVNQPRRAPRRIVPAIPFALTRRRPSTRPPTSEGNSATPVASPKPEQKSTAQNGAPPRQRDDPATPRSGLSHCEGHQAGIDTPLAAAVAHDSPHPSEVAARGSPHEAPVEQVGTSSNDDQRVAAAPVDVPPVSASPSKELETPVQFPDAHKSPVQPSSSSGRPHGTRPSMDQIVFGEAKNLQAPPPASYVPPQMTAPIQSISAPPPGLGTPSFAPLVSLSSQNPPAPHLPPWASIPSGTGVTNGVHHQVAESNLSRMANNGEYHDGYNGHVPSYSASAVASGASRSGSQSPPKPRPNGTKFRSVVHELPGYGASSPISGVDPAGGIAAVPPNVLAVLPPLQPPTVRPSELPDYVRSAIELAAYMTEQIRRPEFADLTLKVRKNNTVLLDIPAHRIVVARSMKIADAMLEIARMNRPLHSVDLSTDSNFVTTEALNEAMRFLYGAPLLVADTFLAHLKPFHSDAVQNGVSVEARHRMQNALSFAATGYFLGIYSVHGRGMEIAKALLRWDTLEIAIDYAWTACCQFGKHRLVPAEPENREQAFAAQLLERDIVDFIAFNFPPGFVFDSSAKELGLNPRLPSVAERPSHNPRLSQIQFGDVPAENRVKPDFITETLSGILLSMPLRILDRIFNHPAVVNHPKWRGADRVLENVISERERRREETLRRYRQDNPDLHMENNNPRMNLVYNLLWKEYITPSPRHPCGYTVSETQLHTL